MKAGFPFHAIAEERKLITSIAEKFDSAFENDPKFSLITIGQLFEMCSGEERPLLEQMNTLEAKELGLKAPYLGFYEDSSDFISITGQTYDDEGKEVVFPPVYLPKNIYQRYQGLKAALKSDIDRELMLCTGYRSPGFQLATLVSFYVMYDFDLDSTTKHVLLPGYSQHCYVPAMAVDFLTKDGQPNFEKPLGFEGTQEYAWLRKHAEGFECYLSYPRDNRDVVMYEPWHWQFR
jgi:D-alanyl-D-alanine carboxypeptidase